MKAGILFFISIIMAIILIMEVEKTDLEVYTCQNIYYINGLRVTSESTDLNIKFSSKSELKKWIIDRTSEESVLSDWETNNILNNYLSVVVKPDTVKAFIYNPYSKNMFSTIFNDRDSINSGQVYYMTD